MVIRQSDAGTHSLDPNQIICREPPPATAALISRDQKICHTYAQWQEIEKRSQDAIRLGQRQPGQSGGSVR